MDKRIFFLPVMLILISLFSCEEKSVEKDYNPVVLSSKDYVKAEDGIFEILDAFYKGIHDTNVFNHSYGYIDACDVLYYASGDSMRFSYGEVNRFCLDQKNRRGMFIANFSGQVFETGVTAHLYTRELFVDDFPVEAVIDIENMGLNESSLPEYNVRVTSSTFIHPDTSKVSNIHFTTDYVLEWAEGYLTPPIHEDDIYIVSGSSNGISSDNYSFSTMIQDPLTNYLDCFWIMDGTSQITVPGGDFTTGTVDYILDDGCNNLIYFYVDGNLFYDVIK
jgi:hypothetical protein